MERTIKGREEIKKVGNEILSNNSVIAQHGTGHENAVSIMNTGFNYNKTSYILNSEKDFRRLCCYSWKENSQSNVILAIPQSFVKDFTGMDEKDYDSWISKIKGAKLEKAVLKLFTDIECKTISQKKEEAANRFWNLMPDIKIFEAHIPKEFVCGMFTWLNGKDSISVSKDGEEYLDFLQYDSNANFYCNLTEEDKINFIDSMKHKLYEKVKPKLKKNEDDNPERHEEIIETVVNLLKSNPQKVLARFDLPETEIENSEEYDDLDI